MISRILLLLSFVLLSNCASSSTAFLGPIFTGAKTGSVYQASLSYGSNKAIGVIRDHQKKLSLDKIKNKIFDTTILDGKTLIMTAHEIDEVELVDIIEEEPLP